MKPGKELLKKYAHVLVCTGANVHPGQVVKLTIGVDQYEFAELMIEECYLAGAKRVDVDWVFDAQNRLNLKYADEAVLSETLPWEVAKMEQMVADKPCRIFIDSADPDALADVDVDKLSRITQARGLVAKPYRNAIDGLHQWLVAGIPSPAWAKKCFPDLPEDEAVDALWDAILKTSRVEAENDPVADWKAHTDFLIEKHRWLSEQHFVFLHYASANGTDFDVELIPEATWEGAGCMNVDKDIFYIPNMPTEEVFTAPKAGSCEGTLVAVKPLSWNGQLIEDFSISFKDGKVSEVKAAKGQELLEKMVKMDEGACMLGEVALVPKESPINQSGILFYNILFDENACCHIALGAAYKECLPGGNEMTTEEATARGINDSMIHVDFMVGADDLSIVGTRQDGSKVQIFKDGTWAI